MATNDGKQRWYRRLFILAGSVQTVVESWSCFSHTTASSHRYPPRTPLCEHLCYSVAAWPPDPAPPPHTCRLPQLRRILKEISSIQNVFSCLVRDRPTYPPGVSPSSDPPGAEGALRRRGCWIPLSSHGSDRADHHRGAIRQVSPT